MDKFLSTHPKDHGGDGHKDAGCSESDVWTMQKRALEKADDRWRQLANETIRISLKGLEQPGNQERRKRRAGVDREIKPVKDPRRQMLVPFAELIADVRRG